MLKTILTYGAIAGVAVGAMMAGLVTFVGDHGALGMLLGYLSMLIALTAVFVGVKRHRDEALGGVIRFLPALGLGLAISAIAGVIYVLAWEVVLASSLPHFTDDLTRMMIAQAKASGATGPALAQAIADAEAFRVSYANPLYRMPMTFSEIFPVGVLVSLISAALLRNPRVLPKRG